MVHGILSYGMRMSEDQYRLIMSRLEGNSVRDKSAPGVELESELQQDIVAYCNAKGWWVDYSRMDLATTRRVGAPDLYIFADGGRLIIVEAKARSEKLKPAQLGIKLKLESLGHIVHVVRNMQEFLEVIKIS